MRHSDDCIYHPDQDAKPPRPGAVAPCCKAGSAYMRRRAIRRERDSVLRDLGMVKVRGAVSGRTYWE